MSYEMAADILVCGAFVGFMGVDVAAIRQFYFIGHPGYTYTKRLFADVIVPGLGFLFCLMITWGLPTPVKVVGGLWFLGGLIYLAMQTSGFRHQLAMRLESAPGWDSE
jgi:hypothetical protein